MSDLFDDFQFKPHFGHDGDLKGFTQTDFNGHKHYFDDSGAYKGVKIKNDFTGGSDYFDSGNHHLGHTIKDINNHDFMNADGSLGHTPKMFDIKDPNFHNAVHDHFSNYRSNLLSQIR